MPKISRRSTQTHRAAVSSTSSHSSVPALTPALTTPRGGVHHKFTVHCSCAERSPSRREVSRVPAGPTLAWWGRSLPPGQCHCESRTAAENLSRRPSVPDCLWPPAPLAPRHTDISHISDVPSHSHHQISHVTHHLTPPLVRPTIASKIDI